MWKVQFILDVILEAFVNLVSNFFSDAFILTSHAVDIISVIVRIFVLKKIQILGITCRTLTSKVTAKFSIFQLDRKLLSSQIIAGKRLYF